MTADKTLRCIFHALEVFQVFQTENEMVKNGDCQIFQLKCESVETWSASRSAR